MRPAARDRHGSSAAYFWRSPCFNAETHLNAETRRRGDMERMGLKLSSLHLCVFAAPRGHPALKTPVSRYLCARMLDRQLGRMQRDREDTAVIRLAAQRQLPIHLVDRPLADCQPQPRTGAGGEGRLGTVGALERVEDQQMLGFRNATSCVLDL